MKIELIDNPNKEFEKFVSGMLEDYNRESEYGQSLGKGYFAMTLKDEAEDIQGAWLCKLHGDWINLLFACIRPAYRRKNWGRDVLLQIEDEARKRKIKGIHLETMGHQSPVFYEKMGYTEFGRIDNYAADFTRFYFLKRFDEAS